MRSLWIASGLAFGLLTLAAIFRPGPAADPQSVPVAADSPRPLAPEDLSQIMSLRAQFGSAADRLGGEELAAADFERELRQVAGIEEESPEPVWEPGAVKADEGESNASAQTILRRAAAELDELANGREEDGGYAAADQLRSVSAKLRRMARRPLGDTGFPAPSADNPRDGLIDNGRASQAQ
jgi:hypothetical protein